MNEKIVLSTSKSVQSSRGKAQSKEFRKEGGLAFEKKQRMNSPKIISVGDCCELKVTALGPKGIGIDEFTYGFSILIPKAQLGETVKAQIKRIFNFKKEKYAVARLMPNIKTEKLKTLSDKPNVNVGDVLNVKFNNLIQQSDNSYIGQVNLVNSDLSSSNDPKGKPFIKSIIIPLDPQKNKSALLAARAGQEIQIQVTKIKLKYAFAKILLTDSSFFSLPLLKKEDGVQLIKGSKITLTLPTRGGVSFAQKDNQVGGPLELQTTTKKYAKHIVILLKDASSRFSPLIENEEKTESNLHSEIKKDKVLFLTNLLGAKQGDKVRVKFTKIGSTFAIGKIVRIAPNSSVIKIARARKNINEMLANGMHYGERIVKCQAKMRSYIWNKKKKKGLSILGSLLPLSPNGEKADKTNSSKSKSGQLLASQNSRAEKAPQLEQFRGPRDSSNLKNAKKGRHLINLLKTRRCLNIGLNQLTKYAAKGRTFLFVGTKKPAAGLIARAALFSKTSFFVNSRWLGGMLTNWKTIIKSIAKIRPILKEKQKVISNILQKRAIIQNRLIKKVLSLRKKARILIKKGKQIIEKVQSSSSSKGGGPLLLKRKELFERGQALLQKRQSLLNKQNVVKVLSLQIKDGGFLIAQKDNKYKILLSKLTATHKKLHDLRLLFILNKELRSIKKLAKEQGKNQYTLSYGKFKELANLASEKEKPGINRLDSEEGLLKMSSKQLWLIPNPPQQILNKILTTINVISNWNSRNNSSLGFPSNSNDNRISGNFSVKEKNAEIFPNSDGVSSSKKSIILTKLLSKFSRFLPYIKNAISSMLRLMLSMVKKMAELKIHLKNLKNKLIPLIKGLSFKNKINAELKLIHRKYTSEQQIIRVLRRKLKRHEAEKKLLQFLPKLRYLPTPKNQIALAIQILMKRFVDPKMKYPMDLIYDEKLRKKSKKVAAARKKKWQRLEMYFGGIANMTKLKKTQISNNVAIIIGQQEEMNAVLECKKLGIKMFHIVDTNCNPGLADHFIPSNDDSRNSIKYLLTKIVTRIRLAQKIRLKFKVLSKK